MGLSISAKAQTPTFVAKAIADQMPVRLDPTLRQSPVLNAEQCLDHGLDTFGGDSATNPNVCVVKTRFGVWEFVSRKDSNNPGLHNVSYGWIGNFSDMMGDGLDFSTRLTSSSDFRASNVTVQIVSSNQSVFPNRTYNLSDYTYEQPWDVGSEPNDRGRFDIYADPSEPRTLPIQSFFLARGETEISLRSEFPRCYSSRTSEQCRGFDYGANHAE